MVVNVNHASKASWRLTFSLKYPGPGLASLDHPVSNVNKQNKGFDCFEAQVGIR